MPPIATRHDRARLPHRLRDCQPEALGQALLHDHVGAALQRVDHRGVLLDVVIGSATRCTRAATRAGIASHSAIAWASTCRPLGSSVTDSKRARRDEVRVGHHGRDVLREAADHPDRVLQRVPARDLSDQRAADEPAARPRDLRCGRPARGAVLAREGRPRRPARPRSALRREDRRGALWSSAWFLAEKTSIEGGMIVTGLVQPLPHEGLAGEYVGVRVADVGAEEIPRPARAASRGWSRPT